MHLISKANTILFSEFGGLSAEHMSQLDKCVNEFIDADDAAREKMATEYAKTFNETLDINETVESRVMQTVTAPSSMLDCSDHICFQFIFQYLFGKTRPAAKEITPEPELAMLMNGKRCARDLLIVYGH